MNTQLNAVPRTDSPELAPASMSATQPLLWSIRRELWETRSIYIAPLAVAAIFLVGFLISTIHLAAKLRAAAALDLMHQQELIEKPYTLIAFLLMGASLLVAVFYCLDALHGERRDRSILFWKSLPVSDLTTVLSKASIPLFVLPLLTIAITLVTQWIMLLFSTAALLIQGMSPALLWDHLPLFKMSLMLTFHLLVMHGLAYAPIYCWLLLVSGWARRAAFLWAFLPPIALGFVEKIAFNTSYFSDMLKSQFGGGPDPVPFTDSTNAMIHPLTHTAVGAYLSTPNLWIGLVISAAFLAAAVRLRRYQGPI